MTARLAIPILILAVLFLPLPLAVGFLLFGVLLAVRPRGVPERVGTPVACFAGPASLRSPPA